MLRLVLCGLTLIAVCYAQECRVGYWKDDCNTACSAGCKGAGNECVKDTGACKVDGGCNDGWEGTPNCDTPICFGSKDGCDYGKCIAPNYCVCGEAGAQVVGIAGEYNGIQGTQCVSLRLDGMKGCLVALAVMTVAIAACGFIAEKRGLAAKNK